MRETHRGPQFPQFVELLRRPVTQHRMVVRSGLQVLPDGQQLHPGATRNHNHWLHTAHGRDVGGVTTTGLRYPLRDIEHINARQAAVALDRARVVLAARDGAGMRQRAGQRGFVLDSGGGTPARGFSLASVASWRTQRAQS